MDKGIYVNDIQEVNRVTTGLVGWNADVKRNMLLMFTPGKAAAILQQMTEAKEAHFITRFCQFIILVQLNALGWSMKVMDYGNDIDLALDDYLEMEAKDWDVEDRNKIMRLVQEIKEHPTEIAKMVIVNPVQ